MKKKLISLLLVSAMAAATAGCGSSVPANSVNSRDDLPGKKIGVQLGTVQPEIRMPQSMKRMMAVR